MQELPLILIYLIVTYKRAFLQDFVCKTYYNNSTASVLLIEVPRCSKS